MASGPPPLWRSYLVFRLSTTWQRAGETDLEAFALRRRYPYNTAAREIRRQTQGVVADCDTMGGTTVSP